MLSGSIIYLFLNFNSFNDLPFIYTNEHNELYLSRHLVFALLFQRFCPPNPGSPLFIFFVFLINLPPCLLLTLLRIITHIICCHCKLIGNVIIRRQTLRICIYLFMFFNKKMFDFFATRCQRRPVAEIEKKTFFWLLQYPLWQINSLNEVPLMRTLMHFRGIESYSATTLSTTHVASM